MKARKSRTCISLLFCLLFLLLFTGCPEEEYGWIAFIHNDHGSAFGNLYTMNYSGEEWRQLTTGGMDASPKWSPDKKKIVFSRWKGPGRDSDIYLINSDGTGETLIVGDASQDRFPVWSPDGERIAFISDRDGHGEIFIYNTTFRSIVRLPAVVRLHNANHPAWSPDGTEIAFHGTYTPGEAWGIYTVNVTSGAISLLDEGGQYPSWSRSTGSDGNGKIVFNKASQIWIMNGDGTDKSRVGTVTGERPCWSVSFDEIVFYKAVAESVTDNDYEIFRVREDGTFETRLTDNLMADLYPHW